MKKTTTMSNRIQLDLEVFQGPFDLLLHLIKQLEIDINDIPMTQITQQYLEYVHTMKQFEIDDIADYLVMASTLIEIKARMLLPVELDETEEYEDPRHELVQHLLLYQQFQDVTEVLEQMQQKRSRVFSKPSDDISHYQDFIPLPDDWMNEYDLLAAMEAVLLKQFDRQPPLTTIDQDPVSVEDKIQELLSWVQTYPNKTVTFNEILHQHTRSEIVATFMALLELVRKQQILLKQAHARQPIAIQARKGGN
ncbi:condensin subunit ScpA [Dolosicoccus paucivorans]|nr:condensin subunit ScpA [Dolosicoccus paucivorans]